MGKKSPYIYTLRTQNQFNFSQHSGCCFHSAFPSKLDEETITGLGVPKSTVRDKERLESERVVLWSKKDPSVRQGLEHNPLHVMTRAGTTSDFLTGP